jgi:hypothetical protein
MWTDFDKCHNLSKRNVKLILKDLTDLEPLRGSSNKKTLYSTRSCVNWAFFDTRGPLKRSFHSFHSLAKWPTRAKKGPIYTQTRQINYYFRQSIIFRPRPKTICIIFGSSIRRCARNNISRYIFCCWQCQLGDDFLLNFCWYFCYMYVFKSFFLNYQLHHWSNILWRNPFWGV